MNDYRLIYVSTKREALLRSLSSKDLIKICENLSIRHSKNNKMDNVYTLLSLWNSMEHSGSGNITDAVLDLVRRNVTLEVTL